VILLHCIQVYQDIGVYMVSDLTIPMYEEWAVPRFMLCGGYDEHIAMTYFWFSSGGTKSILHKDTAENLHCLVSGFKKFVLIKPYFADLISPEFEEIGHYNIDVDKYVNFFFNFIDNHTNYYLIKRVNMTAYPNLAKIPWYLATLKAGDCLFLPFSWVHYVSCSVYV